MPKKFEYKVCLLVQDDLSLDELLLLKTFGEKGWELCSVTLTLSRFGNQMINHYYLKREIKQNEESK